MATGKQAGLADTAPLAARYPLLRSRSFAAVITGLVIGVVIAVTSASRAEEAVAREITEGIRQQLYTPIARATEQAQLLASQAEVREGLTERNRIRLRGALRPALARMNVNYAAVLLPDGTPYYWLPDQERSAPIIARRLPIEHELRSVGTLEFGAMLTDDVVRGLAGALATEVRISGGPGPESAGGKALPGGEVVVSIPPDQASGYAYLRAPDDVSGPPLALLEFRVPATSPGADRIYRTRNLLWAVTAAAVLLVAGYDVRQRRRGRQTPPQTAFAPIQNPYIVGNPIRTPDMFFGRESDFQFAQQKLESERAGLVLVFCGERRSGKTSMLFQILSGRLGAPFLPVLIDMQYFAAISRDQDFYESVVKEFVRAVYPEPEQDARRQRFNLPGDGAAQSFELVLDDALAAYPDKTILFLFDEYEILESKIERGELSRMVIPFLAGLLERKRRISFIFTGSRNLEERSTFHWRLMMGKSLYRKISYLTPQDTERLIRHPVRGLVDYDTAAVTSIYRLTSGQPFYTQVICQNLIDDLNEVRRRTVGPKDVLAIVDGIVDNPLPQMIYFWDSLPSDEKIALSLLAETLSDETSWETAERLLADAQQKGVAIAIDLADLRAALERLFEKELLAKSADRAFQYRIDLLRHWIRRTHSIWQVVKEAASVPHAGV